MNPMQQEAVDIQDHLERFAALCRTSNIRVTPQRLAIYKTLLQSIDHPDAETLYRRVREGMPTVSLDTVYRALLLLERLNLLFRVDAPGDRARFDGNMKKHYHFVCRSCGLVKDVDCDEFGPFEPSSELAGLGVVESVHVQLRGLCPNCAEP